jgi:tetratricopeptide (TPR) repeat protein
MNRHKSAGPGEGSFAQRRQQALQSLSAGRLAEGIGLLEKALARAGSNAERGEIRNHLGTAQWQSGKPDLAEKHYAHAVQLAPDDPFVLNNAGAFFLEQRRYDEAEKLLRKAYNLKPDHYEIPNNLGLLLYRLGLLGEAGQLYQAAIRLQPGWPAPYANLGNVLRDLGHFGPAEESYRQALKLHPQHPIAWRDLGKLYMEQRRDAEAYDCLRRALSLHPKDEMTWVWLLSLLESMNRLDEATGTLAEARRRVPGCVGVTVFEARLLGRNGRTAEAIALLEQCRAMMTDEGKNSSLPFIARFFTELGLLYDRNREAEKAFDCFLEANRIEALGPVARSIDKALLGRGIAEVRDRLTAAKPRELLAVPPPATDRPAPVFLVGFPRSGTTLLDQILSSHPGVRVAEEKPAVDAMARHVRWRGKEPPPAEAGLPCHAACLEPLDAAALAELRQVFYAEHDKHHDNQEKPQDRRVFVDKMPLNLLHAALIRRVFPEAKFLLALRHPCDAVLSCFMQNFELNNAMARFLDLEDSARFYDEAFSLWGHYKSVLPLSVHEVRYEDVVADFRPTVAAALDFLGLPWDDAVLAYDKTARERGRINTPSYTQVTEKIYTRASGRWLRYRAQLGPILPVLEPHARRYGYGME